MKRILFDGTILRFGLQPGSGRSGIFVVATELLQEMVRRGNYVIDVFVEEYARGDVRAYLDSVPSLASLQLVSDSCGSDGIERFAGCISEYRLEVAEDRCPLAWRVLCRLYNLPCSALLLIANSVIYAKNSRRIGSMKSLYSAFFSPMYTVAGLAHRLKIPRFTVLYDTIPQILPKLYEGNDGVRWTQSVIDGLKRDDWCFAISECTKRDFLRFSKHLREDHVSVIPLAASGSRFQPCQDAKSAGSVLEKYGIAMGTEYFLSLCTLDPRKNLSLALEAFEKIAGKNKKIRLVLVGGGHGADRALDQKLNEMDAEIRKRVILTGYVPDDDLSPLYSGACAFVYPSLYEGFGLPPLEAMQCGCPVITSNTSSIPEVVGGAALTIDPTDVRALANAMRKMLSDSSMRKRMRTRGFERAKGFSWSRAVDVIDAKINSVVKE